MLGVSGSVSNVALNGQTISSGWSWDSATNVLSVTGLDSLTSSGAWDANWTLSWNVAGGGSTAPTSAAAGHLAVPVLFSLMAACAVVLVVL